MNKVIYRNIAIVTAIFIIAFSTILVVNYFQTKAVTPLQAEVVETLKQLNDANANNLALQEQIRQLDLMARKAYFFQHDRLMIGVYILLGMLAVFLVCVRMYFAGSKEIPDKEIDPVDEWAIKTQARKYIVWGVSGFAATALVFGILTSPNLRASIATEQPEIAVNIQNIDESANPEADFSADTSSQESKEIPATETPEVPTTETAETAVAETTDQLPISNVTHNAFRGNNSNGISAAKNLPAKWNLANKTNIAWKIEPPRKGHSSPVINGNRVFITGADEQARELYCYSLATGEKLWTVAASGIPDSPEKMPHVNDEFLLAASTVATNGTHVCAIFATGDLMCADMNGNRIWAKNLGVPDNHYGYVSSLLTFGNLLIVQYDNLNNPRVMAFDIATGAERWSKARTEKQMNWTSPTIVYLNNTPQLVLIGCPGVSAYNPGSGEQLWRVECLSGEPTPSAANANGIVFVATELAKLVAINAADGAMLWDSNEFLPATSSLVATKDNLYMATSYGVVASFDTQTGKLRVEHELGTEFTSSPIIADGKVFLISEDGKVHIFRANDEFNLLDTFETGERTQATPAFTDRMIVVRTEKSLYCVTENK